MTNTAEIEKKAESIEGVVFADPEQQYYVYPAEIRGAKLRAVKVGGSERGMSDKRMAEEIKKAFPIYCDWCWQYDYGDCDICKGNVHERLGRIVFSRKCKEKRRLDQQSCLRRMARCLPCLPE